MDKELKRRIIIENANDKQNRVKEKPKGYLSKKVDTSVTCTDKWEVFVKFNGEQIESIKYMGEGCSISCSSINILSKMLVGKTKQEALNLLDKYQLMITAGKSDSSLGELIALDNVHTFVNRIECGLLGAKALEKIMKG